MAGETWDPNVSLLPLSQVAKLLANLAHRHGRTIVCTIHQPSSDIFHLADDLIVLADGQVSIWRPIWRQDTSLQTSLSLL